MRPPEGEHAPARCRGRCTGTARPVRSRRRRELEHRAKQPEHRRASKPGRDRQPRTSSATGLGERERTGGEEEARYEHDGFSDGELGERRERTRGLPAGEQPCRACDCCDAPASAVAGGRSVRSAYAIATQARPHADVVKNSDSEPEGASLARCDSASSGAAQNASAPPAAASTEGPSGGLAQLREPGGALERKHAHQSGRAREAHQHRIGEGIHDGRRQNEGAGGTARGGEHGDEDDSAGAVAQPGLPIRSDGQPPMGRAEDSSPALPR